MEAQEAALEEKLADLRTRSETMREEEEAHRRRLDDDERDAARARLAERTAHEVRGGRAKGVSREGNTNDNKRQFYAVRSARTSSALVSR